MIPLDVDAVMEKTRFGVIPEAGFLDGRQLMDPGIEHLIPHDYSAMKNSAALNQDGERQTVEVKSGFTFGRSSEKELFGVDARLVKVVRRALEISSQDFMVFDGLRTLTEQTALRAAGKSQTLNSKHLVGLAVDLVPWINGKPTWSWDGCAKIAWAMDRASMEQGINHLITWGGAWDRTLADFDGDWLNYLQEVDAYKRRHPGPDFIDGPHFQIEKP
jgi:peptidoglycan L-alanyl-D-glutamate endopeptidase CwlK